MKGYISLWRKLGTSSIWLSEPFTRGQAWVDMLMLASHEDGFFRVRGVRVDVKRGQLAWSQVSLATRWKWSRGKVRRFLSELESKKEQKIVQQNDNATSLITIINYDYHQSGGTTSSTANGQQTDSKRYTYNNVNNVNKEKKEQKKSSLSLIPEDFKVTEEMKSWFFEQGFMNIEIKTATDEFVDYWLGVGKKKKDWVATWRNGMRKKNEWNSNNKKSEDSWKTNFLK